ncbi:MAG: tRNA ((1)-)-methyltransferase, tRNA (guanine37-N1)-methyltransferase [Candidatus Parcubacteria bacterium]|jgi:tRNA (guanine37-N1)-methyltransferase
MAGKISKKTIRFHFITLFPEAFSSYIDASIVARGISEGYIKTYFYNPRDCVKPKGAQRFKEKPLRMVDDRPYGGGPGMVMKAEPVLKAVEKAVAKAGKAGVKSTAIVFLSPGGAQFTTDTAASWAGKYTDIIILCGRYEGIDARVKKAYKTIDVSVGPWVVTGGELPAMIMLDVIARQIPGVLGNFDSREESRVSSHDVYTRPEVLEYKKKKYKVPKVLLSGDHKKIDEWRNDSKQK